MRVSLRLVASVVMIVAPLVIAFQPHDAPILELMQATNAALMLVNTMDTTLKDMAKNPGEIKFFGTSLPKKDLSPEEGPSSQKRFLYANELETKLSLLDQGGLWMKFFATVHRGLE